MLKFNLVNKKKILFVNKFYYNYLKWSDIQEVIATNQEQSG